MSTGKGLPVVARCVMSEGLLAQYSQAKEQIHRVEDRFGRVHNVKDDVKDDGEARLSPGARV